MIRISLIVPVYNGSKRIIRCLNSIINQSYDNFNLLIIDDGSTDNSSEIITQYLDHLDDNQKCKVKFLHQENQGVSKTRNKGITLTDGDWIGFVDQDDYIARDYLQTYVLTLQNNEAMGFKPDILVSGYDRVKEDGQVIRHEVLKGKKWDKYVVVSPWAHLYRREFLVENNIFFLETKIGEDVFFNLKAYAYTDNIVIVKDNSKYKWVFNNESVSNSNQNHVNEQNDPSLLINAIIKMYANKEDVKTPYVEQEYYLVRYIVWYCLFTLNKSSRQEHMKRERQLFDLLNRHYPNYRKNRFLWHKVEGEPLKIYLAVVGYLLLHKIRLI